MYDFVACLRKRSGIVNFQPIVVQRDHRALEHLVTDNVDTPSGPRGRRGRCHEILSQFDLTREFLPGKDNIVADAMSRFAYSATSAQQDVSWHGSAFAQNDSEKPISREFAEGEQLRPLTHFVFHSNLTPEERAKADKERRDKMEKRHADKRDGRRRRRRMVFLRGWCT